MISSFELLQNIQHQFLNYPTDFLALETIRQSLIYNKTLFNCEIIAISNFIDDCIMIGKEESPETQEMMLILKNRYSIYKIVTNNTSLQSTFFNLWMFNSRIPL